MNNAAGTNAFGGGLFFTSNNYGGTLTIADTTMTGNTGGHWTNVQSGSVTNAGHRRRHQLARASRSPTRRSRASPACLRLGTLRGFPNPAAMGSVGQSPPPPDALTVRKSARRQTA